MNLNEIIKKVEENECIAIEVNDKIWKFAEIGYEEKKSSDLMCSILEKEGFTVEKNIANIPTAFVATFGNEGPKIGILAEYDALPNLSQKVSANKEANENTSNGHGCGHNVLGAGCLAAALAVKNYIEENNMKAIIKFFGCPAEESGGSGKVFMTREGCFDDLDTAFTWHPGDINMVLGSGTLANIQGQFTFTGKSAHAALSPDQGRSALDSVEIMNVGANYLREHIIPEARMHYAYINAGAPVTNIVHDHAVVHYNIRSPKMNQALDIFDRVINLAKGSAIMNGTEVDYKIVGGMYDFIPNHTLGNLLCESLKEAGAPDFDESDYEFAAAIIDTLPKEKTDFLKMQENKENVLATYSKPLSRKIFDYRPSEKPLAGSTDVGDVSYKVPMVQFSTATSIFGTPSHTWQMVSQSGSSIAHKGLMSAAKAIAISVIKLIENPDIIETAKKEHNDVTGGIYKSPLPEYVEPNIKEEK